LIGDDVRGFRRGLGSVDFTLLVIGSIIGADIYIVSGLASAQLGPAQLVAWVVAAVLSAFIGLAFVQCAAICPEVGGSYAYAHAAFGPLPGFLAGWTLYLGEWVALPVFPIAFVSYLRALYPSLSVPFQIAVKVLLVAGITFTNVRGIRSGAVTNDVLTVAKLLPLVILVVVGVLYGAIHPALAVSHLRPFAPLGWSGFGPAVVLIFWAYAGFELAVLPAAEVRSPGRTLPLGLVLGIGIATLIYLSTSFTVVAALPTRLAAASVHPLADGLGAMLSTFGLPAGLGQGLMAIGAVVSIAGVYDVFTLGLARLSYAMASDRLFPPPFARLHGRWGTPVVGLVFQAVTALGAALLFDVRSLITVSVFFLGICYVLTALAAVRLAGRHPNERLRMPVLTPVLILASLAGLYLSTQAPLRFIAGGALAALAGLGFYLLRNKTWPEPALGQDATVPGSPPRERWVSRGESWLLHSLRRRRS